MLKFEELNLQEEILKAVLDMGFTETTPIQSQAIPIALTGKDVIGQAQTGTGKTAAFSIPFLQIINSDPVVQVLILTPTRELCIQVEKEIRKLSKYLRLKSVAVYGGQEITRQIKDLKAKPQIIVATPGRLMDHMNRKTIRLDHLKMVVLDEADEMLNMGFLEDIESILAACPEERQTMMFSATMKPEIKAIANKFMKEPELVKVKSQELTVPLIEQQYFEVAEAEKFKLLCRLLDIHRPELAMIFGRTKRRVDELTEALQKVGYQAEGLHGDLTQRHRDMVMNKFRNGQIGILVATDVAARGLDITGVSHVINFDLPQETDSYVHRIGRTGRAGKEGLALTFVEPREFPHLKNIEDAIKRKLTKTKLPTAMDAKLHNAKLLQTEVVAAIEKGAVLNYQELANDLIQEYGSVDALAAVLEILAGDQDKEYEINKIKLTAEKPLKVKRSPDRRGHGRGSKQGDSKYRGDGQKKQGGNSGHSYNKDRGGKRDYHKKDYQKKDYQKKDRPAKTAPQSGKKSYRGGHKTTEA
ncbi:MAG: DEAD/DEAH box helicase [Peptococcaceae bacterium]|nr:DEAD/DEAH box helicase [Peptococcaceae bacterium]